MKIDWTPVAIVGIIALVLLLIIVAADRKSDRVFEAKMQCAEMGYDWANGVCNPYVIERTVVPLAGNE
jgi:F0F1-type ATP synthase membrane subunit a